MSEQTPTASEPLDLAAIRAEHTDIVDDPEFHLSLHAGGLEQEAARFMDDCVPALLAEVERLRAECDRAWDVAVEERLRRLEAQAGIESPPEPEPDPLAGRLPAQVEYGLVWDDLGSADTFPTLEQARAAARGLDEPARVVRIETWPVADEGRAGA